MHSVAIVIPAYKANKLEETLASIAGQSKRDFTVYIGKDRSPHDVKSVVDSFAGKMDIRYTEFPDNLGGKDLVAQWERCIGLSVQEPWILLFSDDDRMPDDAVERILQAAQAHPEASFFRFPLNRIDAEGNTEFTCVPLPEGITPARELLADYLGGKRPSAAIEYVFSRQLFLELGMVHFPLAWCSDTATWYAYAKAAGGVLNLPGKPMEWRNAAGSNISNTSGLQAQKMQALIEFVRWLDRQYEGPKSWDFARKLRKFLETNLNVSFEMEYSQPDLKALCTAFSRFSILQSLKLYRHYRK